MECLRDYIGLRWCGNTVTPPSGFYINDLPGLSLKQIVSLTDEESDTFSELWDTIQQRAELRFSNDVRTAMSSKYTVSTILQGANLGRDVGTTATAADGINAFRGFTIDLIADNDVYYVPSPLAAIHVQSLQFYASGADAGDVVEVAIFDTLTGTKLFTSNVTIVAGWNVIQVNETLINSGPTSVWSVFCGINATSLSTYELNVPATSVSATCCRARIMGAYTTLSSSIKQDDLTTSDSSFGMSGMFTVKCLWDAMVCQNKNLFTRAYWYCLGIELLTENIYSSKLNSYTTINLQKAKELRDEYTTEYMKSLAQACDNMHLDCDCCVECNDTVQLVESKSFW